MKTTKNILTLLCLLMVTVGFAQSKNIFLDRAYWKTNPSIADIDKKINEGHDIAQLSSSAFDAVSWALIEKVDNKTVKYLLTKKENDVNKLTHDGRTYIFWAAYKGNLSMMQYLVRKGAKTDIIDSHGYSLLNFAATTGQLDTKLYDFCIEHGAKVTKEKNHSGANALLLVAPFIKDIKLIDYFTSKGLNLHSTDNNGNGIFNYAAKKGNIELLQQLIDLGVSHKNLNSENGNAMLFACQGTRGHTNTLEVYQFLESVGVNPNVKTKSGTTPLHSIAYRNKDLSIYKYFISKNVDPNQTNEDGNTALMNATNGNDLSIVTYLAKRTKAINHQNKDGKSALTYAISRNKADVVDFLVKNKADVHVRDKDGNSLMYYITNTYSPKKDEDLNKKTALLKAKGLNLMTKQGGGNSLYHIAAQTNNIETLKFVEQFVNPTDINTSNNDGLTALHIAAMKAKNTNILEHLLASGADKSIQTNFGETVYDLAKENELLEGSNIDFLK